MHCRINLIFCLAAIATSTETLAGEWPQILGPNRNGIAAADEKLASSWPASGPKVVWDRKVGSGFSGIAVSGGKAVLYHREDDNLIVVAMDAKTGDIAWKKEFPTTYQTGFSNDSGPRCTPVIHRGNVIVYGPKGGLHCLKLSNGDVVWSRETHSDFNAPEGYFGAGSTPIVEGSKVIVNVGSRNGAGIVSFNLADGKTAWKSTDEYASYSSPVAANIGGQRNVIFITRMKTVLLDPKQGSVRFEFPFGRRGPTVNGASPVVFGDYVFSSSHYGVGATLAKISNSSEVVWNSDELISSHYMTPIIAGGLIYGVHGQERVNSAVLRCIDPKTRKIVWEKQGFAYGSMILADGKFVFMTTSGQLVMFDASSKGYNELGSARLFRGITRALPALSNGLLYVHGGGEMKCVSIGR